MLLQYGLKLRQLGCWFLKWYRYEVEVKRSKCQKLVWGCTVREIWRSRWTKTSNDISCNDYQDTWQAKETLTQNKTEVMSNKLTRLMEQIFAWIYQKRGSYIQTKPLDHRQTAKVTGNSYDHSNVNRTWDVFQKQQQQQSHIPQANKLGKSSWRPARRQRVYWGQQL